ncbi:hypothetical protein C7S13_8321 [Burkholderia cepacia]|nr:hypothetical protein [Burkholderia cepacia]
MFPVTPDVWSDHFPARLHAVPRDFGPCQYVGNVVHPALTSATGHAPHPNTGLSAAPIPSQAAHAATIQTCLPDDRQRKRRHGPLIPAKPAPETIDRA